MPEHWCLAIYYYYYYLYIRYCSGRFAAWFNCIQNHYLSSGADWRLNDEASHLSRVFGYFGIVCANRETGGIGGTGLIVDLNKCISDRLVGRTFRSATQANRKV
jgi:hypothetical protein